MHPKTYKVCKFIYENEENTNVRIRKMVVVEKDLEWGKAKEIRNQNRGSWIV